MSNTPSVNIPINAIIPPRRAKEACSGPTPTKIVPPITIKKIGTKRVHPRYVTDISGLFKG